MSFGVLALMMVAGLLGPILASFHRFSPPVVVGQIAAGECIPGKHEIGVRGLAHEPELHQRRRSRRPMPDRGDVVIDRLELGATLRDRVIEPVVVLEGLAKRQWRRQTSVGGRRLDLGPQVEHVLG